MRGKWSWILLLLAISLSVVIYYDSKGSNVIPPITVILDIFMFLFAFIGIRHAHK